MTSTLSWLLYAIALLPWSEATNIKEDVVKHLSPKLSSDARVVLSTDKDFDDATKRWDERTNFNSDVVVEVASESDISESIRYANDQEVPFIAVNGRHGSNLALAGFQNGIIISMRRLNKVIVKDDTSATIGGGATSYEVGNALWDVGRQAVQGLAECTGFFGPALGGGHSILQGQYGLIVDNILEARVVLADGSVIQTSASSNPDLFWGLRGAGHNFGIVSQMTVTTYDVDVLSTWYFESMVYNADQLEALIKETMALADDQPGRLAWAIAIARMPQVDPVNAIIAFQFAYDGTESDADPYIAKFRALKPIPFMNATVPYVQLASLFGQRREDELCKRDGRTRLRYPAYLTEYKDTSAIIDVYKTFNITTYDHAGLSTSVVLIEGLSTKAALRVPLDSTAVPVRDHGPIAFPVIEYRDRRLDEIATNFGEEIRTHFKKFLGKSKFRAYVNYANGDEELEAVYGYEPWRVEKLKKLKVKYDPKHRFRFYEPIGRPKSDSKDEL